MTTTDSSAPIDPTKETTATAGDRIARWSTQVGSVTVNFAFGHVRDLKRPATPETPHE